MRLDFIWGHGSGNGFPVIDARGLALADGEWAVIARTLADRRGPVGGDGLLALTAGDRAHPFGMRMWNNDGSEAELCLNGLRLVGRLGLEALGLERACVRLAASSAEVTRVADLAPGVATVRTLAGPADLDVARWPLGGAGHELVDRPLPALDPALPLTAVAMPNPHLVAFVTAIDEIALVRLGSMCEAAPDWLPQRANLSFVRVLGPDTLYVRTFERGVGLTDSCGSAMAASAFAACLTGRMAFDTTLTVRNKGGLVRACAASDGMVTISGNATFAWEGSAAIDLVRGTAGDVVVTRHRNDEIAAWAQAIDGVSPAPASA